MKTNMGIPKKTRLLNSDISLECKVERLPSSIGKLDVIEAVEYLTVGRIPVDDLANEAIVVEIKW